MMKGMYGELTKSPNPGTWGISFSILAGVGYSLYFLTFGHEKAGSPFDVRHHSLAYLSFRLSGIFLWLFG